jgi:hypothetical protein
VRKGEGSVRGRLNQRRRCRLVRRRVRSGKRYLISSTIKTVPSPETVVPSTHVLRHVKPLAEGVLLRMDKPLPRPEGA